MEQIATKIYWRVGKILYPNVRDWISRFLFDVDPEKEIFAWLCIAEAFESLHIGIFNRQKQREVLRALLLISIMTVDVESQTKLSSSFVQKLRNALERAGESIIGSYSAMVA